MVWVCCTRTLPAVNTPSLPDPPIPFYVCNYPGMTARAAAMRRTLKSPFARPTKRRQARMLMCASPRQQKQSRIAATSLPTRSSAAACGRMSTPVGCPFYNHKSCTRFNAPTGSVGVKFWSWFWGQQQNAVQSIVAVVVLVLPFVRTSLADDPYRFFWRFRQGVVTCKSHGMHVLDKCFADRVI